MQSHRKEDYTRLIKYILSLLSQSSHRTTDLPSLSCFLVFICGNNIFAKRKGGRREDRETKFVKGPGALLGPGESVGRDRHTGRGWQGRITPNLQKHMHLIPVK